MPPQSSELALQFSMFRGTGKSVPFGNKKVSWSFSSPSFHFQLSPVFVGVLRLFQFSNCDLYLKRWNELLSLSLQRD